MNLELLTTERLLLRKWTPSDFDFLFENYTEKEIRKELGLETDREYETELNKYRKGYATYRISLVYFQVIDKLSQTIIGGCGFHNWYADHNRAELGYALTKEEYKRKGLMKEALQPVLAYGFDRMKLGRVEALISPSNVPSLKLIHHFGFTREGHLRKHYVHNGIAEDSLLFSLLREEYKPDGAAK